MEIKVGDVVHLYSFGKWRIGEVIELDSELYVKFKDCAIVGILNDTATILFRVDKKWAYKPKIGSYEGWCFYSGALFIKPHF